MNRIRILPEAVANKSQQAKLWSGRRRWWKELLENAIDAGAKTIRVEVEVGGNAHDRVIDDGHGMRMTTRCWRSSAMRTSKLRSADDLLSIATLVSREALPTIAAISLCCWNTRRSGGRRYAHRIRRRKLMGVKRRDYCGTTSALPIFSIAFRREENF